VQPEELNESPKEEEEAQPEEEVQREVHFEEPKEEEQVQLPEEKMRPETTIEISLEEEQDEEPESPLEEDKEEEEPEPTRIPAFKRYKTQKGDQVDEFMAQIINTHHVKLPIVRIGNGKYLIGTESRVVIIKGTTCVVRVGGGFENMEEYILRREDEELDRIRKLIVITNKTYTEVIRDLLIKFNADTNVV